MAFGAGVDATSPIGIVGPCALVVVAGVVAHQPLAQLVICFAFFKQSVQRHLPFFQPGLFFWMARLVTSPASCCCPQPVQTGYWHAKHSRVLLRPLFTLNAEAGLVSPHTDAHLRGAAF